MTLTKKRFWIYIAIAFFAGFLFTTKKEIKTVEVTKEVPKEVVKEVKVPFDYTNVDALISTDNQLFSLAGDGFGVCSQIIRATAYGDSDTLKKKTDEMLSIKSKVDVFTGKRNLILQDIEKAR